jgi:hypothetical protein
VRKWNPWNLRPGKSKKYGDFINMNDELVGGIPTALKNMSSSVGIMKFPIYGKIKNVPNHQPGNVFGKDI